MSEIKLKPCPFCGSEDIYETYLQEYALGTKNPEIFCNTCKAIFAVEDDSPYLNCDEDFKYRREKTAEAWNKRAELPSAQPEITLESAIDYLHSIGWMQEHDRIMAKYAPVAHAHNESETGFLCSACRFGDFCQFNHGGKYIPNYCPNCGAKMDEVSG